MASCLGGKHGLVHNEYQGSILFFLIWPVVMYRFDVLFVEGHDCSILERLRLEFIWGFLAI